jgi:integrase
MNTSDLNNQIADSLDEFGLPPLPETVVDSHGLLMKIDGDIWKFNTPSHNASFDFKGRKILNPWLEYSLKRHLIYCIRHVSPLEAYNIIRLNTLFLMRTDSWDGLRSATSLSEHVDAIGVCMGQALEQMRLGNVLYNFARLRAWYCWCVDYLPDLGFDSDDAYKWEMIRVPGNEKGIAVRTGDPEGGPLNDPELILMRRALQSDKSIVPEQIQQRSALWLALVYGRNPSNFTQIRRGDFVQLMEAKPEVMWTLKIPRIKKRGRARTQFKEEYVDPTLASVINELIAHGPSCPAAKPSEMPLFVRFKSRSNLVGTGMDEWAWHLTSNEFTLLIQRAILRYGIISPRTGEPLCVTTRRLRYTFATNLVREGISARDLAIALDHSDLQHVQVYFDARSTIVERLDRAAASVIAPMLKLFIGSIVKNAGEAINGQNPAKRIRIIPELIPADHHVNDLGACGKREFCNLFPPYSCYPCDRFQPFSDSLEVHELVFDFLIERRDRLRSDPLESSRIAVQLDEVIYACAEVVMKMKNGSTAHGPTTK